jgi:HEAT repeat protein
LLCAFCVVLFSPLSGGSAEKPGYAFGSDRLEFPEKPVEPNRLGGHFLPYPYIREFMGADYPLRKSAECGLFDGPTAADLVVSDDEFYCSAKGGWQRIGRFLKRIENAKQFELLLSMMHQGWAFGGFGNYAQWYDWPNWKAERLTGPQVRRILREIDAHGKELSLTILNRNFDDKLMSGECYLKDGLWLTNFALVQWDSIVEYKYAIDRQNRIARRTHVLAGPTRYAAPGAPDPMIEIDAGQGSFPFYFMPEPPEWKASRNRHEFLIAAAYLSEWRKNLGSPDIALRSQAFSNLLRAGERAKDAIPELLAAMAMGNDVRISDGGVVIKLEQIGPAAVPELRKALRHPDRPIREKAVEVICELCREDGDDHPRFWGAFDDDMQLLGEIIAAFPDSVLRRHTTSCLRTMDEAALPALRRLDANYDVVERRSSLYVHEWCRILSRPRTSHRLAASVISRMGPLPADTLPDLRKALADEDQYVRRLVAYSIGHIVPAATEATADLRRLLKDRQSGVRIAAAEALARIGQPPKEALPDLCNALRDENIKIRRSVIEALGYFGPAAADALPDLRAALQDESWNTRQAAAEALGRLGPNARSAAADLRRVLERDKVPSTQRYAEIGALARVGPPPTELLSELFRAAKGEGLSRRFAVEALGYFGAAGADAVPVLKTALEDQDWGVRLRAAEAMGRIGPSAKDALPALQKAHADYEDRVRDAAAKAIEAIKGK